MSPLRTLSQADSIVNDSPSTPVAKTVTNNSSQPYPSEEDISSLYSDFADRERILPLLPALGELIRILFVAFRMTLTLVTYIVSPTPSPAKCPPKILTLKFSEGITFAPPEGVAYVSAVTEDPSSVGVLALYL
ncbi:hypothetical protein PoB_002722600 [Plakobranchus ocellatus]|uniref:Uncharacterized protein n=1 Tax=Plakobranchus ocellatus TaxID=259542 RepID=A0AAV4A1W9_9GAST|nr:hypothetical protein PoB_002722600 [Plakobranchus ocellatus]